MNKIKTGMACIAIGAAAVAGPAAAQQAAASFFVASVGSGSGGWFGGLQGADWLCQTLATAAGSGGKTWRAYLSNSATAGTPAVNARDRIGKGPWQNVKGVVIAKDLAELHGTNQITKPTALTEKGTVVNGFGDTPNQHDILTGSQPDGTAFGGNDDKTCGNWTKNGEGSAIVGHVDRTGTNPNPVANASWNSAHGTAGCSIELLAKSGSAGYLYCFAAN
ncbi:MAG: hypothetical protein ABI537_02675 [Casimicrobiaceae bacterium]